MLKSLTTGLRMHMNYQWFIEGTCNGISEEQIATSVTVLEIQGCTENDDVVGTTQFSKEPSSVVSREGDTFWTDVVYWVVESLFSAEESGIEHATATEFPETPYFGGAYTRMYQHAIAQVGNNGEMCERHLQKIVPQSPLNPINNGTAGLMYSFPFGSGTSAGWDP